MSQTPSAPTSKRTVKIAPLSSNKKKKQRMLCTNTEDDTKTVHVVHVRPGEKTESSVDGLILINHGYSDKAVSDLLCKKADNKLKVAFIKSLLCLNKPVSAKNILSDPTTFFKSESGHDLRAIVILTDFEDKAEVRNHVNDHCNKHIKELIPKSINTLSEQQRPKMRAGLDCSTVDSWSKILGDDDCLFVVQHETKTSGGAHTWHRMNNENVHNIWLIGEVPLECIGKCGLNQTQLNPLDWQRQLVHEQEEATMLQNLQPDLDNEANDENSS